MRDADVYTLHAPRAENNTLMPKRAEVTRDNALLRVLLTAGCDLEQTFRGRYRVEVLPSVVKVGRTDFVDKGDAAEAERVYVTGAISSPQAETVFRMSPSEVRDAIAERIEHDWTHAILIVPSLSHSKAFDVAVQAAQQVALVINRLRKTSVVPLPFQLGVIDSGSFSAGAGVLAFDAVARAHVGLFGDRLTYHLEGMRRLVHTFVALKDYSYLEADRGQLASTAWDLPAKVLGAFGYNPLIYVNAGKAQTVRRMRGYEKRVNAVLEQCIAGISAGLKTPAVCVSFAGPMSELKKFALWPSLARAADERRIRLMPCPMSPSEGVRLGPGAIVAAFASSSFRP